MDWVGVAYIALLLATVFLGAVLLVYTLHRRTTPGALPLAAMHVLLIWWALSILGEIFASSMSGMLFFHNLRQFSVTLVPVGWLVMAYEVYWQDAWRDRQALTALLIVPAILLVMAFSNDPYVRENVAATTRFGLTVITGDRGAWATVELGYSYTLIVIGILLLIDLMRRTVASQRYQTAVLIAGIVLTMLASGLDVFGLNPIAPLSPVAVVFLPAGACFMYGLFRHRLLEVLPVAHERVLEAIADGVLVVNGAGMIVDLNRAARDIFARTLPKDTRLLGNHIMAALAGWPEWQPSSPETRTRFEVTHKAGQMLLTYEVEVTSLTSPNGDLMGQIMLINDITAQKEAMELYAERERVIVLQQFIRDASHDLRTPMSVIQSSTYLMKRLADKQIETLASLHPRLPQVYAAVIEEGIDLTGKIRDRAVAADDAAKRLWSILFGMIELAEIETAGLLEKQEMDFNLIVAAVIKGRRMDSERQNIAIDYALDNAVPRIVADEKRLSRAIDAVLLNAIQYTAYGGKISVRTFVKDARAVVEIKDTGIGIGPEDMPRIYERFFRADRARSTETGGAGLGLSLVKAVMDAHGGYVSAESQPGAGSTFRLALPI